MEIDPEREAFMLASAEKALVAQRNLFAMEICHPPLVIAAHAGLTLEEFLGLVARHPERFERSEAGFVRLKPLPAADCPPPTSSSPERSPNDAPASPEE